MSDMRTKDLPITSLYKAITFLGEGLNSCVYRGFRSTHHDLPTQEVAIKIFKKSREVQDFELRFQKLVRVRSRYCVGLLGWERIGDQVAIIMDYIEGVSLNTLVHQTVLTRAQKIEILAQLKSALEELHGFDIVHGDLNGSNIMIDGTGQLRLIDYGFGQNHVCEEIVGSPRFLSPNRWLGEPANQQDDLFSSMLIAEDLYKNTLNKEDTWQYLKSRAKRLEARAGFECTDLKENQSIRLQLAEIVQQITDAGPKTSLRSSFSTLAMISRTQLLKKIVTRQPYRWVAYAFLLLVFVFPTLSGGSFVSERTLQHVPLGFIEFRTQRWFEIDISGRKLGFAPLKTNGLLPGRYKITWRSDSRRGALNVWIDRNSHLILTDEDLLR